MSSPYGSPIRNHHNRLSVPATLEEIHERMARTLPVKDHRSSIWVYKNSFTGEAFVAWILGTGFVQTLEGALDVAAKLISSKV